MFCDLDLVVVLMFELIPIPVLRVRKLDPELRRSEGPDVFEILSEPERIESGGGHGTVQGRTPERFRIEPQKLLLEILVQIVLVLPRLVADALDPEPQQAVLIDRPPLAVAHDGHIVSLALRKPVEVSHDGLFVPRFFDSEFHSARFQKGRSSGLSAGGTV